MTIFPDECKQDAYLLDWDVKRFGPYTVCTGGRVTFRWRGMHGVFQIPSIACPSNFTAQQSDSYKYLTSVSNGGGYEWKVPEEPGHYWVTSQHNQDCKNGMSFVFIAIASFSSSSFFSSFYSWLVSYNIICRSLIAGMLAEFFVVNKDDEPFLAASAPGWALAQVLIITMIVNLVLY